MSEISVLSNQYEKLVEVSEKINNSVIALKKKGILSRKDILKVYPKLSLSASDYSKAAHTVLEFLENLFILLNEEKRATEDIPLIILDDYLNKLKESQHFKEDLENLISDLRQKKELEEKDIQILDRIISVLDSERTLLFRKLRMAR